MLWYDGRIVEGPVPFDLSDRGLLLGDGVFDTALALDGKIAFEDAHVDRLVTSADTLGFTIDPAYVMEAMRAVAVTAPCAAIRTTVTRGTGPRGISPPSDARPLLFASAGSMRPSVAFKPMRCYPTSIRRNDTSPVSRIKTLGYLDAVLSAREASVAGFDDALFLNTKGRVACAGIGNIFAVVCETLITPPVEEGILAGITRAQILTFAPQLGLDIEERPLVIEELKRADAVFLTNSLRLLSPITAIGDDMLPSMTNRIIPRLVEALRDAVAASCDVSATALP